MKKEGNVLGCTAYLRRGNIIIIFQKESVIFYTFAEDK